MGVIHKQIHMAGPFRHPGGFPPLFRTNRASVEDLEKSTSLVTQTTLIITFISEENYDRLEHHQQKEE